ncbi:zinc finger BED domain-containing protein 4-like [Hemicordylus capensis]|uniref:zinc finger BED domain-containing protein 4-like n=1 Tax=Hemicordylus capensis TaxID=884348 RepID=UPI0023020FBA|nr:zinc finger BED domain-containing protein 4-like [Hemicordylus capensis]
MRRFSDCSDESDFPEVGDLVPLSPLWAHEKEGCTDPPFSEVHLEDMNLETFLSLLQETEISEVQTLSSEEDVSCLTNSQDIAPVPFTQPRLPSFSASRTEKRHDSEVDPMLHCTSPSTNNAPISRYQRGQVLLPGAQASETEAVACESFSPQDTVSAPVMQQRPSSLSASSAERHHGSAGDPMLQYMSAGPTNATLLGDQSGQVPHPGTHASVVDQMAFEFHDVFSQEEQEAFCLSNPQDTIMLPATHPGTTLLSASSAEGHHGTAGGPMQCMSAGTGDAAILEHKSGQVLFPGEHISGAEQMETSHSLQPKQRKSSPDTWQQFDTQSTEKHVAVCKICHAEVRLPTEGGYNSLDTDPVFVHLVIYHPDHVSQEAALQKQTDLAVVPSQPSDLAVVPSQPSDLAVVPSQPTVQRSVEELEPWGPTHPMAMLFNTEYTWMLVEKMIPCSLVDDTHYQVFMRLRAPQWKMPGQSFFKWQAVPALENNIMKAIEQGLKRSLCSVVHFTISSWIRSPHTGYMSLTAHWLMDTDGILSRHQAVMAMCVVRPSNMTEIIPRRLKEVRDKWLHHLQLQLGYVATDICTVGKAIEESCLGPIPCVADCLNQVMQTVMEKKEAPIEWLLQTLQEICRYFQLSQKARSCLSELQSQYGLPQEQLPQKVPSAWKEILNMLQFLVQEHAFCTFLKESPDLVLTLQDWRLMHHLACLLTPFEDTIMTIRKESASLGQILHELHSLESRIKGHFELLQQERELAAVASTHLASELLQALESSKDLGIVRENIIYQSAAFLHPSFRDHINKYLRGDVELIREQLKERVIEQTKKEYLRNLSSSPWSDETIDQFLSSKASEVARRELESYLQDNMDPLQLDVDPLVYWNAKRHMWPFLSVVALEYFSCPPTTVYSKKFLGIVNLLTPGSYWERLAFMSLNRDWLPVEFRVPPYYHRDPGN